MNLNVVSPINKSDFTATFKEPLVIDANSSAYLNFSKFTRKGQIVFKTNQLFRVVPNRTYPNRVPSNPNLLTGGTNNLDAELKMVGVIPSGGYSVTQLQEKINDEIKRILDQQDVTNSINFGGTFNPAVQEGSIYVPDVPQDDNNVHIGFNFTNQNKINNVNLTTANSYNCRINGRYNNNALNENVAYQKIANDATRAVTNQYDNYNLEGSHYLHLNYGIRGETWNPTLKIDKDLNHIYFRTLETLEDWVDPSIANNGTTNMGHFIGLYSNEYAAGVGLGDFERTAGNTRVGVGDNRLTGNPTTSFNPILTENNTQKGVPTCFFGVTVFHEDEIDASEPYLHLWAGSNITGDTTISELNNIGELGLDKMILITKINLNRLYATRAKPEFRFYTYNQYNINGNLINYDSHGTVRTDRTEFRIDAWGTRDNTLSWVTVYDTAWYSDDAKTGYFDFDFFEGYENELNPETQSANEVNSQIPFNIMTSTQSLNSAFEVINYSQFDKFGLNGTNANPRCLIESWQVEAQTNELADLITGVEKTAVPYLSKKLFCNFHGTSVDYLATPKQSNQYGWGLVTLTDPVDSQLNRINYSIYINNLPLQSFKNYEGKTQGFKKNILANVPLPYANRDANDQNNIIALYQPSFQVTQKLKNQQIITNNIQVSIRNMETDEPVNDIEQCVINFTII